MGRRRDDEQDEQDPKEYAEGFFDAITSEAESEIFSIEKGSLGKGKDKIDAFFVMGEGEGDEIKPVALVLTDDVSDLLEEALSLLYEGGASDQDEEDEKPRGKRRGKFVP